MNIPLCVYNPLYPEAPLNPQSEQVLSNSLKDLVLWLQPPPPFSVSLPPLSDGTRLSEVFPVQCPLLPPVYQPSFLKSPNTSSGSATFSDSPLCAGKPRTQWTNRKPLHLSANWDTAAVGGGTLRAPAGRGTARSPTCGLQQGARPPERGPTAAEHWVPRSCSAGYPRTHRPCDQAGWDLLKGRWCLALPQPAFLLFSHHRCQMCIGVWSFPTSLLSPSLLYLPKSPSTPGKFLKTSISISASASWRTRTVTCTTLLVLLLSVKKTHAPPTKMNPSTGLGPKPVPSFQALINNMPKQRSSSSPSKCSSWAHHLWKDTHQNTARYLYFHLDPLTSDWLNPRQFYLLN